jgi:acetyl esterase
VAAQLLLYPVCDSAMDTASYRINGEGYHLTREAMQWFWDRYAPPGVDRADAELSPARRADVSKTPRTLVIAAEFDPLRDEAAAYAARLSAAGVPVRHVMFEGLVHGFFRLVPSAPWVEEVIGLMAETVDEAFRS